MNSSQFDLQRLGDCGLIKSVDFREITPSTNDLAKQLIQAQPRHSLAADFIEGCPKLVLTSCQTSGRGQNNRTWWSGQGSLTFSLVETMSEPALPLTTGLATAWALTEMVKDVAGNLEPRIKWPNDLYLNGRKMAGILVESIRSAETGFQIVGVGINVNNVLSEAPEGLRKSATSLADCTGEHYDLTGLLVRWLDHYFAAQKLRKTDCQHLVDSCLDRSQIALGQAVTLMLPEGSKVRGNFSGLTERGGILLELAGQRHEFLSATLNSDVV